MNRKNKHSRISRCDCGCGQIAARVQFIPSCYCGVCGWMIFDKEGTLPAKGDISYPIGPMDVEQMREYIDESLRRFHDER